MQKLEKQNQRLIYELATCLPLVKLEGSDGMYLVGTEFKKIQMKGRGVLVRTGGGYMYLSEYLLHYAKAECLKIGVMMLKLRKPFKDTILHIIGKRDKSQPA